MKENPYVYKKQVMCAVCEGTGQIGNWADEEKTWLIKDCVYCQSTGRLEITISDGRRIATKKTAILPKEY